MGLAFAYNRGEVKGDAIKMKKQIGSLVLVGLVAMSGPVLSPAVAKETTSCEMEFDFVSTAVFYKKGTGAGTVRCDNGQSAEVKIKFKGGGLTFGKDEIVDGKGRFSEVADISELFGGYATAEASAGAQKSAAAQAMWKGDVSLSLTGLGKGVNVGFSFGKFKILPK